MIKKILGFFILLFVSINLDAQTPFIRNFSLEEYKAHPQNWSIAQDQRGLMYFGNGSGILEYDGTNWRTIETQYTASSLAVDSLGCIYVGLNNDFGYLQPDSTGSMQYKSLKEKIPKKDRNFNSVWETIVTGNRIVFRTVKELFILKNNCISVLSSNSNFRNPFVVDNRFYITETGKGLLFLENDSLCSSQDADKFSYEDVISMISYDKEDILVTTFERGVFIYNPNKSPSLWKPEGFEAVDKFLFENAPYCGTLLPNGTFAIGTSVGGVLVFDKKGKIQNHFSKQNGLQSNDVHYLFVDSNDQLWVALDKGISLIMSNLPFTSGTDKNGIEGTIYSIHKFKNKLYVGTNQSLYVQNAKKKFECIEGTEGQNYFLYPAEGKLLLGNHPNGMFNVFDDQASLLKAPKDLGSVAGISLRKHSNYFISQVWDSGLALLEFKNEKWSFKQYIKGFDKNALSIKEDMTGDLWMFTGFQLYKIRLNETLDSVVFLNYYSPEQYHLPKTSLSPYQLNDGEIIFGSDNGIYRYLSDEDSFELHPDFPMFTEGVYNLKQDASGNIWFNETRKGNVDEKGVLQLINGKYKVNKTPFLKFLDSGTTFLYPYSDSLVYFGTANGLLEYHPKQKVNYNIPFNTLIRKIFVNDSLISNCSVNHYSLKSNNETLVEYKDNNLFFHYTATFFEDSEKNLFSHRLIGFSDTTWSAWTNDRKKEYTNLHEGKYIFEVKSRNIYRKNGRKASFAFEILPPWHRTWLAYLLYGVFVVISILIIIQINSARLKRQNEILKQTVKERTVDILQQKEELQTQSDELQATNEKLIELDQFKEGMTGMIVHDLKNPLSTIIGLAKSQEIVQAGKQMLNMVLNILDVQKFEDAKVKLQLKNFSVSDIIRDALLQVQLLYNRKSILVNTIINPNSNLRADIEIINRVVVNILTNAIKYTPNNGSITIKAVPEDNSDFVKISISDTGEGIRKDNLASVFDKFSQVEAKKSGGVASTGLGLTFCKLAIEAHGGEIGVESEYGQGTTFWFLLPKDRSSDIRIVEDASSKGRETDKQLTDVNRSYLAPFIVSLKKFTVYEFSDIITILNKIESNDNDAIQYWKMNIENALRACNEERYDELLKQNKDE